MKMILAALLFLFAGAFAPLFTRNYKQGALSAVTGQALAFFCGIVAIVQLFIRGTLSLKLTWNIPFGSFFLTLDHLSALFFFLILLIGLLAGIYGVSYLSHWQNESRVRLSWAFYNLLLLSMCLVVLARNGILFLLAWEVMTVTSFFLVTFESEKKEVLKAGWVYLVAAHIGTAFLLAMFILLAKSSGSFDFDQLSSMPGLTSFIFIFALIGFGVKAGFLPLHVWLPEAHPAAPSHVSAVMSAVMVKMGIYGILRTISLLGAPAVWWGWALIALGAVSAVIAILFACAQHDMKRLLAYSTIENVGLINLGLGLGILGFANHFYLLGILGFAGALLHILNHALFKTLLFLGAGAVFHATGTRDINCLGGLTKRMPYTATAFFIGVLAVCALPPLNGFYGEFLIYLGAFQGVLRDVPLMTAGLITLTALSLVGCLAVLAFTKLFGIVFSGEPRSQDAGNAHEAGAAMRFSLLILAFLCIAAGILSPYLVNLFLPAIAAIYALPRGVTAMPLAQVTGWLVNIVFISGIFILSALFLFLYRKLLFSRKKVTIAVTWDCGYAKPDSRMQYTGSSFVQPVTSFFRSLLQSRRTPIFYKEIFAGERQFTTRTPDIFYEKLYQPAFDWFYGLFLKLHYFQRGRIQVYVLYIAFTLIALLIWKLR